MVRIRYTKQTDGTLISNQAYVVNSDLVKVIIESDLTVNVRKLLSENNSLGTNLFSSPSSSLVNAKKLAKATLLSMGVNFSGEIRRRETLETTVITIDDSSSTVAA